MNSAQTVTQNSIESKNRMGVPSAQPADLAAHPSAHRRAQVHARGRVVAPPSAVSQPSPPAVFQARRPCRRPWPSRIVAWACRVVGAGRHVAGTPLAVSQAQ